jgi:hypothetical protein
VKTNASIRAVLCALALSLCAAPAARAAVTIGIPDDLCSDSTGEVTVPLRLTNDEPVRAIFAKITSPSGNVTLAPGSAACAGRAQGFACQANTVAATGQINLVVLSLGGKTIAAGDGPVMTLRVKLANGSCESSPESALALQDVDVANPANEPIEAQLVDGHAACECRLEVTNAKQVVKCQPAVASGTQSLVVDRLKALSACGAALFDCEQKKPGDAECIAKAKAKCEKGLAKLPGTTEKFVANVEKGCSQVGQDTLLSTRGLEYSQIADQCSGDFAGSVGSVEDIARCVAAQHACRAEELVTSLMPRVRELAEQAQVPLGTDNCLGDFSKSRSALAAAGGDAKALLKCQKAITKAGASYVSTALKRLDGCVAKVLKCLQLKPGDAACVAKAKAGCTKQLDTGLPALSAKLGSSVGKGCAVPFATLSGEQGLGLAKLEELCKAVDVDVLGGLADYQTCLARQHQCLVRDLLLFGTPRAGEVLRLVGDTAPSFCH